MLFTFGLIIGGIIGFVISYNLNARNETLMPIRVESSVDEDVRTIRRIKEIEFWQNLNNGK